MHHFKKYLPKEVLLEKDDFQKAHLKTLFFDAGPFFRKKQPITYDMKLLELKKFTDTKYFEFYAPL